MTETDALLLSYPTPLPGDRGGDMRALSSTPVARLLAVLLLLLFGISGLAQNPYRLSTGVDAPTVITGFTFYTTSFILHGKSPIPDEPTDFLQRSPDAFNFIDRIDPKVSLRYERSAHRTSNVFLYGSAGLPILAPLLAGDASRTKMGTSLVIVLEGVLANAALTNLTKELARRPRPYTFGNVPQDVIRKSELYTRNSLRSFFSGHTSIVASNSFLAAKMLNDFYPDSRMKPAIWATAVALPAITGYLRVRAGKHFVSDVLVGFIAGAAIGWVIPELHR